MRICPQHNALMVPNPTKHGIRYACPVHCCTVVCWDGSTSTPADLETRQLRHEGHCLFDPLWKDAKGPFQNKRGTRDVRNRRDCAYSWLSKQLGISWKQTHFGMFDAVLCAQALEAIHKFRKEHGL